MRITLNSCDNENHSHAVITRIVLKILLTRITRKKGENENRSQNPANESRLQEAVSIKNCATR